VRAPGWLVVVVLASLAAGAAADAGALLDGLATDDPSALARAIGAVEAAPTDADALFAAARACEERLGDPRRALALYDRILRDAPDERVASAAAHRAARLRTELGADGAHATEAAALAGLIATADRRPAEETWRAAAALAAAPWPGAPDAALWLGEWQRRRGEHLAALETFEDVLARWPASPQALVARREAAAAAVDAGAWDRAAVLAEALPHDAPSDQIIRDELLTAARAGRAHGRWYLAAWVALVLATLGLLAALLGAARRGGWRVLRPPGEVLFLGPIVAILGLIALTTNALILPAVATIGGGGLGLAWMSGAALDAHRAAGRSLRLRAPLHAAACVVGVVALGYLALTRDGLLELLVETMRAGPEG
jgi:hypothetical protein